MSDTKHNPDRNALPSSRKALAAVGADVIAEWCVVPTAASALRLEGGA